MKTNKLYFLILMVFLASCGEDFFQTTLDVDPPEHTDMLAVTAFGETRNNVLNVRVSRTIGLLEDEIFNDQKINDADVKLFKDDVLIYVLDSIAVWSHNFTMPEGIHEFEKGATYKLEVTVEGYPTATALSTVPLDVIPTEIEFKEDVVSNFDEEPDGGINITFQDPAGENFYETQILRKQEPDPNTGESEFASFSTDSNDPVLFYGINNFIFNDVTFDEKVKTAELLILYYDSIVEPEVQDDVYIMWRVTTEPHYLYNKTVERYFEVGESPFASPTQIYSNMENGIGVFSIVNESYIKLVQ